jgi:TolB protein
VSGSDPRSGVRSPGRNVRGGSSPREPGTPGRRDPYGLLASNGPLAPVLSIAGLLVIALLTVNVFNGRLPFVGGNANGANGGGNEVVATPAPPNVVIPVTKTRFPGSIVYAKQGSIWIQNGTSVRQLTSGADDASPSWAPDGSYVYFIRTVPGLGRFPSSDGSARIYELQTPLLMRVKPDGGDPQQLASGKFTTNGGRYEWWYWLREPTVSPDGSTIALVSDAPDPTRDDVVLQFFNLKTRKLTKPAVPETQVFGHQDPAWRPDGTLILYVRNSRDGASIWRYDMRTRKTSALSGSGYIEPAFSPDGRWVAATKTNKLGTDVVILDARNGSEVARVTTDGASWAPAWSPAGDSIAFLHVVNGIIDLRLATLTSSATGPAPKDTTDLTQVSGLDGASRPSWFIPADQLPSPAPSAPSGSAGSASPSTGP